MPLVASVWDGLFIACCALLCFDVGRCVNFLFESVRRFHKMALSKWRGVLAHLHGQSLPLDLADAIVSFPVLRNECGSCLGIMMVCLALKLPVVRRSFMEHWRKGNRPTSAEGVFDTLTRVAIAFSDDPPVTDTQQIGGPLYAHGWQMLLSQMCVVADAGRGRCVYLGIGRKCMRLQSFSDDARAVIGGYLNLHPLIFSLIHDEGPRNLQEWGLHAAALYEAFNFWSIPGLRQGSNGYCGQWIVRTLLVAMMRWKGIAALELSVDDEVTDLCGPDESGTLAILANVTKAKDAQRCLQALKYKGPPELLAMWACLRREEVTRKKRKTQERRTPDSDDVRGVFFLYKKRKFQTLNSFIKRNSRVSSSWTSASRVNVEKIKMKNTLVFPAFESIRTHDKCPLISVLVWSIWRIMKIANCCLLCHEKSAKSWMTTR